MTTHADKANPRPVILCIGGTDPTGRAGLAADIRAGEAAGVHVAPVPVTVVAQNAKGVQHIEPMGPLLIASQIKAVLDDLPVRAIKIGLMPTAQVVESVAAALAPVLPATPLVIDPVLGASSGGRLVPSASREWRKHFRALAKRAALITPNILEASALLVGELPAGGRRIMRLQARALFERYQCAVLLKGGHLPEERSVMDVLHTADGEQVFLSPRVPGLDLRGTGCTLATLIAAGLARGEELAAAVARARAHLLEGLRRVVEIGGEGPPPVRLPPASGLKGADEDEPDRTEMRKTGETDS